MGLQNNFNDGLNQVAQTAALVAIAQRLGCNSREELVSHIRQIEIDIDKAKDENKSYKNLEALLEEYQNTLDEYDEACKEKREEVGAWIIVVAFSIFMVICIALAVAFRV